MLPLNKDAALDQIVQREQRVIGIDPGTKRIAWAVAAADDQIRTAGVIDVSTFSLGEVGRWVVGLNARPGDRIAIELPGTWLRRGAVNAGAMMQLHRTIGALMATAELAGLVPAFVDVGDVKEAIADRRNAQKEDVHRVLRMMGIHIPQLKNQTCAECRRAGEPDDHSPDAADAIAIAIYGARLWL